MSERVVSILGCGWVGEALFHLLEQEYLLVHCLGKDIEKNDKENRYHCDVLVIAIPPRGDYVEVLKETMQRVAIATQVILLSSISFYEGKPLVVEAEVLLRNVHEEVVILRLGGLMGYDRIAGKYTAGKVVLADSNTNYVHRDDVIGIIKEIITQGVVNEVFDIVAPIQSTKQKIFSQNSKRFGFADTEFLEGYKTGKELSPAKVCKRLGYTFKNEDVNGFWD